MSAEATALSSGNDRITLREKWRAARQGEVRDDLNTRSALVSRVYELWGPAPGTPGQHQLFRDILDRSRQNGPARLSQKEQAAVLCAWEALAFVVTADAQREADRQADPGTRNFLPPATHAFAATLYTEAKTWLDRAYDLLGDKTVEEVLDGVHIPAGFPDRDESHGHCPPEHFLAMESALDKLHGYAISALVDIGATDVVGGDPLARATEKSSRRAGSRYTEAVRAQEDAGAGLAAAGGAYNLTDDDHELLETYFDTSMAGLNEAIQLAVGAGLARDWPHRPQSWNRPPQALWPANKYYFTDPEVTEMLQDGGRPDVDATLDEHTEGVTRRKARRAMAAYDEVLAAVRRGDLVSIGASAADCPYGTVFEATRRFELLGEVLDPEDTDTWRCSFMTDHGGEFGLSVGPYAGKSDFICERGHEHGVEHPSF